MTDSTQIANRYLVDDIEIDAGTREVQRGDDVLDLPGLTFDLLLALVHAEPNVLSHEELEQLVWNGRSVSPETVTQRVKLVRDALGDATKSPRYIAVVRGRGYRLVAPVEAVQEKPKRRSKRLAIILSGMALVIAIVLVILITDRLETHETIQIRAVPELPSIAVLFFDDLSENRDQEYFSNGMSETLIRELAQVTGLKVIAKTSSFYFKNKEVRIVDIADELRVGHVLEGSVQKVGNRVRVTAQLIDVTDNSTVWSENFDRDLVDLFAVQDEIALEVVEALRVTMLDTVENRLAQRYRPSLEAYEQVIFGRQETEKDTVESMAKAEQHFLRAIELDRGYALAYVGLATTYHFQVKSAGRPITDSIARRQPLLEKALELDPFSGEAYAARADLHRDRRDFELAESDFRKAIELSPNYANAHQWYGAFLRSRGRFEESLARIEMAAELDPIAPYVQSTLASSLWFSGRVEEALTLIRRGIDKHPELPIFPEQMTYVLAGTGHEGEAQWWHDQVLKLNPHNPNAWWNRCMGFLNLGDPVSAVNCADQLKQVSPESMQSFYLQQSLQAYRGDFDAAIATQEAIFERLPRRVQTTFLANLVAGQGDIERAQSLMTNVLPGLLEDEVELGPRDVGVALTFAAILHANSETAHRDVLLRAIEARMATMNRYRGDGYDVLGVYIHEMRGDRGLAIAGLREAIRGGWKLTYFTPDLYWWHLSSDWKLKSLHKDPEFITLVNELEAEIAVQRQWYEENRDKPLF